MSFSEEWHAFFNGKFSAIGVTSSHLLAISMFHQTHHTCLWYFSFVDKLIVNVKTMCISHSNTYVSIRYAADIANSIYFNLYNVLANLHKIVV